jgi:hypothetical protein
MLTVMTSPSWCADFDAVTTSIADVSSGSTMEAEVKAAFARFVADQNAHDPSVISGVIVKSRDLSGHKVAANQFGVSTQPWPRGKVRGTAVGLWILN